MKTQCRALPIVAILVCFVDLGEAAAQRAGSRVELGGQFSALRLSDFGATNAGLGGRLSYDLAGWATAEGEFNFFPHDDIAVVGSAFTAPISGSPIAADGRRRSSA